MTEFFKLHARLTAEDDMVKHNGRYYPLSDYLTEQEAQRILMILLENPKSREVVMKMRDNKITGAISIFRHFKQCNWNQLDKIPDITDDNQLHFEYVHCGAKGANKRCPFSTPLDPKPYCIVKSLFNIPNHALCTGNKHITRRVG